MTTTPPTTTETTAGSNVVAAYVARLEWELEQDLKDGSSRTTFPTLALRAVVNDYRTLQRELAASREREARLREALRRSDELDTIDEGYGEIAGIARAALTETEATR